MPKIFRFAVSLFFSEYLQRNFCSASEVDLPTGAPERSLNDYVCRDQYFTGATVKASIEHACEFMHTTSRQAIFPALLEDNTLFGRDSGTLLTWPLTYEDRVYKFGTKGKYRAVFNQECNLVSVIIRYESHIQPCLELHDDNEEIDEQNGLESQKYVGYKCLLATFSFSYVWDSFNKALSPGNRASLRPYAANFSARPGGAIPLVWPLFEDHVLSPRGKNVDNRRRYYVVFTRKEEILKVIQVRHGEEIKCELIRKTIVPFISSPNIPHSPESLDRLNDLTRNCDGQIFTGRYIEINREKAMIAISDSISGKNTMTIPRSTIRKGVPFNSWIWPIRGWETTRKGYTRIRSYALIFGPNCEFLDVHILRTSGFTKCQKIQDSRGTMNKKQEVGIDLNTPAFCKHDEGFGRDC